MAAERVEVSFATYGSRFKGRVLNVDFWYTHTPPLIGRSTGFTIHADGTTTAMSGVADFDGDTSTDTELFRALVRALLQEGTEVDSIDVFRTMFDINHTTAITAGEMKSLVMKAIREAGYEAVEVKSRGGWPVER